MAKINDIIAYPPSTPVLVSDIVIGSVGSGGDTKNFLMSDIKTFVNDTNIITSAPLYAFASATQSIASGGSIADILFGAGTSNDDAQIFVDGSIKFKISGVYIVEFSGNFKLSASPSSQVVFQPFLDDVSIRNSAVIDLPSASDIFRSFTRTDIFQVSVSQVLKYKAGHVSGTTAQLIAGPNLSTIQEVPAASVTVSRIKI